MEPPKYLPRCKNCNTLYPFPIYKPGEPPIMPKCSFCQTEMEPPKGPKCQKCGAPISRLTREERKERMELYKAGKNPEPRKCKQCGEELKMPRLPFFKGPFGPFRRLEWIISWEMDIKEKDTSLIRRITWTHYSCLPMEHISIINWSG